MLWYEHDGEHNEPSFVEAAMPFAMVVAVGGVGSSEKDDDVQ